MRGACDVAITNWRYDMLTEEEFLLNGYKRFDGGSAILKHADYLLQRCIRDEKGKKYYLTVYVYVRNYSRYISSDDKRLELGFMPEVQFREDGVTPTIDVTFHNDESTTLESMEAFFESMWVHLGKPYADRYED